MIGWVLLFVAVGLSVVLVTVFLGAVRAKALEREELMRQGGADEEELEEARRHRPAVKGWLVCSGVVLVLVTVVCGVWIKGCQMMGRSIQDSRDLASCRDSLGGQADWVGVYWDKHRKLPGIEQYPPGCVECPAGNDFVYTGHRKVLLGTQRVIIVELQPHRNGQRHALVAEQKFIEARKAISSPTRVPIPAPAGAPASGAVMAPVWGGWRPYAQWFKTRTLSESEYERIRPAVERAIEGASEEESP